MFTKFFKSFSDSSSSSDEKKLTHWAKNEAFMKALQSNGITISILDKKSLPELNSLMKKNKDDDGFLQMQTAIRNCTDFKKIVDKEIPKKIKAASLVFDDTGNFIDRYDKIHLFDTTISQNEKYNESNTTDPGDKVVLINTPFGKIGLAVCYDLRFPELFRYLFNMGAEIFVVPSAFTTTTGQAHWELLTRSRAVENFCYLIGACQGGTHANGRKTYGNSIIVDPWGTIIAHKDAIQPGIIYADIDLDKLYEIRKSIPVNRHQRIFFDMSQLK